MFQGIFKSAINDANKNYIFGTGSIPIQIKSAQLATFADGTTKQQGYQVTEVNKLISTMLTGWSANGNKPKSMSNNYLELTLSCDNGFVVKKRLQFPHIIAWQNDSTPYNIADVYKEFSIDNWLKADDFENPDITLVVEPTDEILTTSTATPPEATTTNSGRFYLYYRNLPVGINRIHIDFHIKTRTEPIDFDLEIADGMSWKDAQIILASNEQAKINVLLSTAKDVYKYTGAEGNFEEITMHEWSALYQQIISLAPSNKFTHDLYFYLYEESEISTELAELEQDVENIANSKAMKMTGDFVKLLENQSLNDSGEQLTLPILKQTGFANFVGVKGKIYTNAANLVKLLLNPGTITYNGVTLTIDDNFWVTITGTATATGYICYNNLTGYASLDTAKADITIPKMPSGNYKIGITQKNSPGSNRQTIYIRSKTEASFIAILTGSGSIYATIDMSAVGAMGAYLINGTTYNERFRFMVMPSSVFSSLANITVYEITDFSTNIRTIETDGIYKYENYTIGDGTATSIEKMLPVENYATKGVTCLWFGDSISEFMNLPHLVGEKLAVNVIDVSEAGSPFIKTGLSKWYDTGVESLVEQKIANNFSPAETALSAQLADDDITQNRYTAKMANLESLKNCDMSSIKKIVILAGTNDLTSSDLTLANFKTGIANTLTKIFTKYPEIQVYCITPPYRTDADNVRPNSLVLADIVGAIIDVCKSFGVPCFDFLANCGVNSANASHWLTDGLHPSKDGDEMFSTRIANWLKSIF